MARRDRSFSDGGTWKRPDRNTRDHGRSRGQLQDRASYDQQPKSGGMFAALGRAFRGNR